MLFPTFVFGSSSRYFVVLIVLLRLVTVKWPMNYESIHQKVTHIGCIIVWAFSLLVPSIVLILYSPSLVHRKVSGLSYLILIQLSATVPTLLTISIYVTLLYTLKKSTAASKETSKRIKLLAKMTHGIVVAMVVFSLPGIAAMQYFATMLKKGINVFESDSGVRSNSLDTSFKS